MAKNNIQNKTLFFDTPLTFKAVDSEEGDEELIIEGSASTDNIDRMGDIIEGSAWNSKALRAYKQNPIILAFHNHEKPVGTALSVESTGKGLKLRAKISKGAPEVWHLIKDGVLKAFSVGFMVKEADYDKEKDIFYIKQVELLEVSVVSVPANPYTTFNVSKSFRDSKEFEEFKKSFVNEEENNNIEEINTMAENNVEKSTAPTIDLEALAAKIKSDLKAEQEAEAKAKAAEEAKRVEMKSMVEDLVKEATKAVEEDNAAKIAELQKALAEKEAEVAEIARAQRENKMSYSERGASRDGLTTEEKDNLVLLSKLLRADRGQKLEDTKMFKQIREKSGMEHWDAGVQTAWEEEFSTRVHNEMREELVVERIFQSMPMNTPTMYMPVNPEAGYGEWIAEAAYRSSVLGSDGAAANSSTGLAVDHELNENILVAHKLATKEFIGYEEEEDSIVPLLPIIRDAIARRMARSADLAILRGDAGSVAPFAGLTGLGSGVTDVTFSAATLDVTDVTDAHFITARKNLGIHGLNPNELVWIVSHELYYHMMGFTVFKTMDQIGDRATIVTGQVGAIYGTPVVVSQQFDNTNIVTPAAGAAFAVLVRPSNFVKGELRTMRTEQWLDVPNQKRGLVATRRFGFKDLDIGKGVAKMAFVA